MTTWTVTFESAFSIFDIEANSQEEAGKEGQAAIEGIEEVINNYINRGSGCYALQIGKVLTTKGRGHRTRNSKKGERQHGGSQGQLEHDLPV